MGVDWCFINKISLNYDDLFPCFVIELSWLLRIACAYNPMEGKENFRSPWNHIFPPKRYSWPFFLQGNIVAKHSSDTEIIDSKYPLQMFLLVRKRKRKRNKMEGLLYTTLQSTFIVCKNGQWLAYINVSSPTSVQCSLVPFQDTVLSYGGNVHDCHMGVGQLVSQLIHCSSFSQGCLLWDFLHF